jgi:hypothetical protein
MNSQTALVTGASSGIGLHLAHEFARHGHPLVLTAPVESELREVAAHMKSVHGVEAHVIAKDLEQPNAAQEIFDTLQSQRIEVDILVNNAGHGQHGKYWEVPIERHLSIVQLNIDAVLRLTSLFLPPMLSRGRGRLLNTSSVGGFLPGPMLAVYHASKAFVLSWSEALATELEETGITVTTLCPGPTDTDFFPKADMEDTTIFQKGQVMAPQEVAEMGYKALMSGDRVIVTGAVNKAMVFSRHLLPEGAQAKMQQKFLEKVAPEDIRRERGEVEAKAEKE